MRAAWTGLRFFSLLSMVVIGLLVLRFFPGVLETGAGYIDQKPWQSLGFGFLKLVIVPIVAFILMLTVIGFPIGVFLMFVYAMELYFATYVTVFWFGRLLYTKLSKNENRYWAFIIGAIVFAVITNVPLVSGLIRFFVTYLRTGGNPKHEVVLVQEDFFSN